MKDKEKNKNKSSEKKSSLERAANRLMPYILSVIAAFLLFALTDLAGGFGTGVRGVLYGIFGNFATYFLPIFMIYHAIMWNYDIKRKICIRRVVCTFLTLICFSTMQYLVQVTTYSELDSYDVITFYTMGSESHGGGFFGGIVGKLLLNLGNIAGVIIITLILMFMLLQMFNITPAYMVRSMRKNKKPQRQVQPQRPVQRPQRVEKRPREEFLDVSLDDDTIDEAYLDTSEELFVDDVVDDDDDTGEYEALDVNEINSKMEHIPSQLQPYNGEATLDVTTTSYNDEADDEDEELYVEEDSDTEEIVPFEPYEREDKYETTADIEDDIIGEINKISSQTKPQSKEDDFVDEAEEELDEADEELYVEEEEENSYISADILEKASKIEVKPVVNTPPPVVEKPKVVEKVKENKPKVNYTLPPLYYLKSQPDNSNSEDVKAELQENAKIIVDTLNDFKAATKIVDVTRGPTITRYELQPEKGVRVRTIEGLVDDIALNLAAKGLRIECPIPGKNAIGIEVPNRTISFVYLRDLIEDPRFERAQSKLTCALGKSISGENIYVDIEATPHLLVAGATGMGKSVCINSLLVSLLYKAKPDEVRLIMIDPKRVELSNYNGIPHLLVPVVCEPKKSLGALQWAVTEMEERFMAIEEAGVRNIKEFNERVEKGYKAEKMARIVIVIDELADLKMAVPDIEGHITRLTQKARAAGIHIIIGTQRPSVDVLTGLIKNNIPSRIAFRVPSQVDSRTILDEVGAEKLVSKGDMLVKLVGALNPVRVQGAYVSVDEIQDVIDFWKDSGPANYDEDVMQKIDNNAAKLAKSEKEAGDGEEGDGSDLDPEFYNALGLAVELGKISSSLLMRKLSLGFGRASRVIDQMEEHGYVGEANGPKPRDVLISKEEYQEIMMRRNDE